MNKLSGAMIHVKNRTLWNTADLRRLYAAALKAAGAAGKTARLIVKGPKRGHLGADHWSKGVRGHCYFGSHARPGTCTMFLPDAGHAERIGETHKAFILRVARVMHHEALHAVGARHKDMTNLQRYSLQDVPWAEGFELRWAPWSYGWEPAKEKPVVNLVEVRAAHAEKMLKRAQTRLKRARTLEKKWVARVRYYERKQAANK